MVCRDTGTVFKLYCRLPRSAVIALYYKIFFVPTFVFWRDFDLAHRSVRLFFEIILSAWVYRTLFGFSDYAPRVFLVYSGLWCFLCLVEGKPATVVISVIWVWSLRIFADIHSIFMQCRCNMCVCVSNEKVSILITYLESCYNIWPAVTQFICEFLCIILNN